jgi:hypothetical protein
MKAFLEPTVTSLASMTDIPRMLIKSSAICALWIKGTTESRRFVEE